MEGSQTSKHKRIQELVRIQGGEEDILSHHIASMYFDKGRYGVVPNATQRLARFAVALTANEFDCIMAVIGTEGKGKSHLAGQLGMECATLLKKEFSVKANYIFNNKSKYEAEDDMRKTRMDVRVWDEGRKWFYKRDAMTLDSKNLIKAMTDTRANCNIHIIAVSDVADLDKEFRERRVRLILLLLDRGYYAIIQSKNIGISAKDNFMIDRYAKNISRTAPHDFYFKREQLFKLPTCLGFGEFKALEGTIAEEYKYYKRKYNILGVQTEVPGTRLVVKTENLELLSRLLNSKRFKLEDFAEALRVDSNFLRSQVERHNELESLLEAEKRERFKLRSMNMFDEPVPEAIQDG